MNRYRDEKIPIDKFELSYSYNPEVPQPIDKWLFIALENDVKSIFYRVPNFALSIFIILEAKSLRELVVECSKLMPVILFSSGIPYCTSLRKLSLTRVKLDEYMLQTLLNCCPLIANFIFEYCIGLEEKLISKSQLLKDLKIQYCKGEVEIDSSNLESIEYMGYEIPKLKIARQLKKLKMDHYCSGSLKAAWFYNLRKFLSNSASCPQVSLWFSQCNEINLTDLQLHHGVATPKVDVLNVSCRWTNGECATFLDALLWSCHPRRLNVQSTSATFKCFINRLIYLKNLSQYSPWHSQFKEAQVYMFDFDDDKSQSWRPVQLKIGELSTRIVSEEVDYFFLLDW
ncbi:hypothetical protein MTR67_019600 [Solanum verrucosum]|uniref:At1g61320/AtMIF1 LRR domain-containing protein n=1 Tax=Solanum verrucosum TaxID=315347 RepID=A0AAF0TU37_SOLVR|nr:hypothetical protein MTR67_019600 [Solanum verrucosum]